MDVVMPQLGETVDRGTVAAWRKAVGERVEKNEPLFDVETDKVATEIPAPASGVLREILVPEGETVKVGVRLAVIEVEGEVKATATATATANRTPTPTAKHMKLSPLVRRLLDEHHLEPTDITGTGAEGRITRDDVLAYVEKRKSAASRHTPPRADADSTVVAMNRIRRLTAEHTARSAATAPHVLQAVEVDFSAVDEARRAASAEEGRPALSHLPFVARAVCEAIRDFPHVNASVSGESLVVHRRVHLGIAVDLSLEGLVVPVVRDAQQKSVLELASEILSLAKKAKRGELTPDDIAGGTYTISNNGSFGTLITAPIIHQPQVAVLSTDAVRKRAVVVEGPDGDAIAIRPVGVLAQCFDHRAFDGAYSASFLAKVKDLLERRDWRAELG
jgi:pyruvate dehydrogenase E2 component (dihydrolipoamide acetyltransferase)